MAHLRHGKGDRGESPNRRLAEAGMIPRLGRKMLSAEVLGPVLVLFSLQMLAYGISSSLLGSDTFSLFKICSLAAALGWLLSKSKLNGFYSALLIAALGMAGIWIVGARLCLPLLDLTKSIAALLAQIVPAIREKIPIDSSMVQNAWTPVIQSSSALAARWQTWLLGFSVSVKVNDALIRGMIWSFILWGFGAWSGWFAVRRNAMLALLPGIGLLALVVSYSEYRTYTLWLMVILMLLLMGVWNYKNHTIQWERHKVDYSDSIVYDNTQAVILLAFVVGSLSFSFPSVSWQAIRDAIQEHNKNQAAEILGVREQTLPPKNPVVQKPSLPREHLLTEGFAQSQEQVMTIRTGELPPFPAGSLTDVPRHYWRSVIYDRYMGTGWGTSGSSPQSYRANTPLIPGLLDNYQPLHLKVELQQPEGRLFWSGLLYTADVPFRVDWRVRPQSDLFADQTDLLRADIFAAATRATAYEADSYIPRLTVDQLRSASRDYPADIQSRYLQLPGDLPARVRQLAKEITGGKDNPYDQAKAIETYLRTNYPYDLKIPAPPQDQDVADYFLFDLKRGYCDYYATAMVVLARASGLPARFVSGYSPGFYDSQNTQYVIRKLNAHSWAEVYFPKFGWIEFEPTAAEPEIKRALSKAEVPPPANMPASSAEKFLVKLRNTGTLYWLSPFFLALSLALFYFFFFEELRILHRPPRDAVVYIYQRYYRLGRALAGPHTRAETASEFTSKLVHKIEQMHNRAKGVKSFTEEAQHLTNIYLLSLFSNHSIDRQDAKKALDSWKLLRRQIMKAHLKEFVLRRSRPRDKHVIIPARLD